MLCTCTCMLTPHRALPGLLSPRPVRLTACYAPGRSRGRDSQRRLPPEKSYRVRDLLCLLCGMPGSAATQPGRTAAIYSCSPLARQARVDPDLALRPTASRHPLLRPSRRRDKPPPAPPLRPSLCCSGAPGPRRSLLLGSYIGTGPVLSGLQSPPTCSVEQAHPVVS